MSAVSALNPRLEALRTGFLARDHKLFVDGRWAAAQSDESFDVLGAANIWTRDIGNAMGLARRIQAGNITVNGGAHEQSMPLGGFKQSGLGREGGRDGVEAYTELKIVSIGL
jgi:acyl-CoA reductase-like NAD-dependent aldehyde dehydrogenase